MEPARHTDDRIYELHASVCQILSNPTRLKILNALREQEMAVAELARRVGTSMPNLSQHLAILKAANPKILRAFDIMREVLFEQLSEGRRLVKAATAGSRRSGARS
ncbi:MAG: transcriptional regulator [Candidatus Rokubacteria bacterium]|nr:transcriptional regulator [Candidatus Rokubacteria bacterium]